MPHFKSFVKFFVAVDFQMIEFWQGSTNFRVISISREMHIISRKIVWIYNFSHFRMIRMFIMIFE
jgi:hypothetical protein